MPESSKIISEIAQPIHVTLTKNTKGYQWEISVYDSTVDEALNRTEYLDEQLKAMYGGVKND